MAGDTVTADLSSVNGQLIITRRAALGMSRVAFAQLIGVAPGALWRFEVRDVIKDSEREHLLSVADRWLTCDVPEAARPARSTKPRTQKKPELPLVDVGIVKSATIESTTEEDNDDLIQWADAQKPSAQRRFELVFPLDSVSPTAMSALDNARRVSNSEVQTFKRCRRKWWLVYLRGLRSVHEQPYGARAIGTRGHAALAAWYRPSAEERVDPRDALEIIIDLEREQLTASPHITQFTLDRFNKDVELERVVIDGYVQWLATTGADAEYQVIGPEQYLEAELPEVENTRIIARLDARVVRAYDNARLFIDHKFVASIPGAAQLLPMNEQMMWYVLLEQLQLGEASTQRVGGALYNMLRRCKRTDRAQPPFYDRIEVHHNQLEITSFRQRLVGVLDDMKYCRDEMQSGEQPHQLVVYPTPTRDCAWDCPFLRVCTMADDGSRFEDALADHYVVGDPYGYYQSKIQVTKE